MNRLILHCVRQLRPESRAAMVARLRRHDRRLFLRNLLRQGANPLPRPGDIDMAPEVRAYRENEELRQLTKREEIALCYSTKGTPLFTHFRALLAEWKVADIIPIRLSLH